MSTRNRVECFLYGVLFGLNLFVFAVATVAVFTGTCVRLIPYQGSP